ncbi:FHA domain-containing protein [Loa loa]|uniref:FHA domain-containing protein n=1 Tax=Loa loa TaxID=7209 RepID=A0A1S0U6W1_LOALO|nr:FHA domain-containing protein [Loa loa]EFO25786.2 FHA domain-containing protein [Loa loa]
MDTNDSKPLLSKEKDEKHAVMDVIMPVISITQPNLEYVPPPFAVEPPNDMHYGFEVIKNGTVINKVDFGRRKTGTFLVIGRLPSCDIQLEHPTISRHHCILQYGDDLMNRTGKGWHIYDLGSTHGTKLNKKEFHRNSSSEYVSDMLCRSSRIMTLFGPNSDTEEEWEYSPTEMRRLIEQKKLYDKIQREKKKVSESEKESDGIMWGIDYDEELAYAQACYADDIQDRGEKYRDDPLKVLSRFFEKEGFDMNFTFDETGMGQNHKWICSIELPVDTAAGQSLSASAVCSGSKKEAQVLCAFNACKTLDMHNILFRSNEARRKAKNLVDNDYYDSDEDTYLDRTGQIEKNREKRRQRALEAKGKMTMEIETFETLTKKIASISKELCEVEAQLIAISKERMEKEDDEKDDDDLDKFCKQLGYFSSEKDSLTVKMEKSVLRHRLVALKHEKERLEKLAKIAKPVELPTLKTQSIQDGKRAMGSLSTATMKKLMKMRQAKKSLPEKIERSESLGMELPLDTFIRETADRLPFIAEVEDDEKTVDSVNTASNGHRRDLAVATNASGGKESNISTTLAVVSNTEKVINEEKDETTIAPSTVAQEIPQHMQSAVSDEKQPSTTKNDNPLKRKRIRIRDVTSSKLRKNDDYGEGIANRNEDYIMWMPPENQKGDGTNALNAKFAGKY